MAIKVPCGGFELGDGLTLKGNVLNASGAGGGGVLTLNLTLAGDVNLLQMESYTVVEFEEMTNKEILEKINGHEVSKIIVSDSYGFSVAFNQITSDFSYFDGTYVRIFESSVYGSGTNVGNLYIYNEEGTYTAGIFVAKLYGYHPLEVRFVVDSTGVAKCNKTFEEILDVYESGNAIETYIEVALDDGKGIGWTEHYRGGTIRYISKKGLKQAELAKLVFYTYGEHYISIDSDNNIVASLT